MQKIGVFITSLLVFLLPLWFLPITPDFYEFNKQVLLIAGSLVLFTLLSIQWLQQKQIKILRTPLDIPTLLLLVSFLLSTVFYSPNKSEALLDLGQTGTYLACAIIAFAIANFVRSKRDFEQIFSFFLLSTFILSIIAILWGTGLAPKIIQGSLSAFSSELWSPSGNPLNLIVFLLVGLIFAG